jgi:hypothetical protein
MFDVTLRFQYPAYDETRGIEYPGISARSKAEAIKIARRRAYDDGHVGHGGKGRVTFSAQVAA